MYMIVRTSGYVRKSVTHVEGMITEAHTLIGFLACFSNPVHFIPH